MGFLGFLKFILLCVDFLAWPVFALGYPLCASIRAIESGSKYHMRKLVIYWTIFSLIYLLELAFVKIIEWIPFWSCLRLMVICWLVIPQFNGASHTYQSLVHPFLSVNLQAIISRFYKPKEGELLKNENFIDVADKYIKENGLEALEKLIASKRYGKEPDSPQKDKEMIESIQKSTLTEAKVVHHAHSNNVALVEKKEMTVVPPEPNAAEKNTGPTPINNVQREWTCALCLVTTTSEKTLNAHLQGSKHKSRCEALRTSKNKAKDTEKSNQENSVGQQKSCKKTEERVQQHKQVKPKQTSQAFKLRCGVCDVKLLSDIDLVAHLNGKRHLSNIQ
ncbi:hypothetical protein ACJIZ3_015634 [Penstemon smallii]|uniref:HVA22-like protein n=1 Tax=Penstemon smallii TaxID=265156 RepID=A0ABD3RRF0_9LAMI